MLQLRDYQRAAVDSLYDYWRDKAGSPLIVLPTGAGKSACLAYICKELVEQYPDMRILCVTHVRELIIGNFSELLKVWPHAPAGIYSAGVGRRDANAQIVFAGIQTIYNKMHILGDFDLIAIDEAHLIPRKSDTQYGKLFDALPDAKRIGLTATPYRLGEGLLHEGEGALFDDICFEQPVTAMIDGGYLVRPISKGMATTYDVSGVGKLGGDYKQNALQAAVDKDDLTRAVVDEIVSYGNFPGGERKAWLAFCSGVEHAYHMRDEIRSRGFSCEAIDGTTPKGERDKILADFKAGKLRALTNNSVLTTGTNLPIIDLVAFCRPTQSCGLYLQMAGRGLRLAPGKENCLFLDFAGVVRKHGPIDAVVPPGARTGTGEAPVKCCPAEETDVHGHAGCGSLVHASAKVCPDCGFEFPVNEGPKISRQAEDTPILSKGEANWRAVTNRRLYSHEGKPGKKDSVKVSYTCGLTVINDWLGPAHDKFFKSKTDRWWIKHGGARPAPKTVLEFLERQRELAPTAEVSVAPEGRYWSVKDYRPGERTQEAANDNAAAVEPANDNRSYLDDLEDLPF